MPDAVTLTLRETHRAGGGGKTARTYFDFCVSGRRLLELLGWTTADYITPFGWGRPECQAEAIAGLLRKRKSSLSTGRHPLYVCPECGDLGCGAVTALIERESEFIVWREFGFENNYEAPRLSDFSNISPIYFKANAYWQVLRAIKPHQTPPI